MRHIAQLFFAAALVMFVAIFGVLSTTYAATVTDGYDQPTSLSASASSNHKFVFTLQSALTDGETMTLSFPTGFSTTTILSSDLDFSVAGDQNLAADCSGSDHLSAVMSSNVLTFTVCAGDGGGASAGQTVVIEIGTNASAQASGSNRITNPTAQKTYYIALGGTFGDTASIAVPIAADGENGVSASVPSSDDDTGGGHGDVNPNPGDEDGDDSDPVGPVDPVDTVDPADPADSVDSVDPDPTDPEVSTDPSPSTEPTTPADQSSPTDTPVETENATTTTTSHGGSGPAVAEIDVVDDGTGEVVQEENEDEAETTAGDNAQLEPVLDSEPGLGPVTVPEPEDLQTPRASTAVTERVVEAVTLLADSLGDLLEDARAVPEIQQAAKIAVPVVAVSALASTAVMASSFSLLPYLHYLITSPVLFFWRRKRKSFGVVYNAVTKVAVDLATVRLYDAATNRLVRSAVTDSEGKYFFIMNPGSYRLAVAKMGYDFPSQYLVGVKDDGAYLDVYGGQIIQVTEQDASVAANIPLDPRQVDSTALPAALLRRRWLRMVQYGVAVVGVVVSVLAYVLVPSTLALVMIGVQVGVFLLACRLAWPRKPKGWGIVYDAATQKPVGNAVVRLFEPKYNKLVDSTLTDSLGRYSFVLGPNEYFVSYDKRGYAQKLIRPLDYRDKEEPTSVTLDIPLERTG